MVTPNMSADCANVTHARHELYARTCVVAYWRLMATDKRHKLHKDATQDLHYKPEDNLCLGRTQFATPWLDRVEGRFDIGRFLGVRDLVEAFEGAWGDALMGMLVDPVLKEWVPNHVVEQYERWNPYFRECVQKGLQRGKDGERVRQERYYDDLKKTGLSDEEALRKSHELKPLSKVKSNKRLLAYVRREMVKMHEKAVLEQQKRAAAAGDVT